MRKIYCDGCDEELKAEWTKNQIKITIENVKDDTTITSEDYDFCKYCKDKFLKETDPHKWTRIKEMPK